MRHEAVGSSAVVGTDSKRRIVLVGNPNSGKSVLFNALTGLYVDVSNYPGTTLDISSSEIEQGLLIDTPESMAYRRSTMKNELPEISSYLPML